MLSLSGLLQGNIGLRVGHLWGRRRRWRGRAEINMVPFIDVMLVLLIIFMVSAP
ncbi:MAG: biopolymer transporter ExbD, partial [Betaproteobacteria bacterium]